MEKRSLVNLPIIPNDNPKQALRIRRFFAAAAAYVICGFFCYFSYLAGFIEWKTIAGWLIIASSIQIIMYILFRTGLNLKMADPSLTAFQMCAAILLVMYVMYFANEARSVLLLIYVSILLFGIYRLNTRGFLYVSAFILLTYGGVIALIHVFRPRGFNFQMEYLQFFVLAFVLLIFSVIGGHISGLRNKISEDRSTMEWLTDNIQDVIFVLDMNLNYIYVSPSVKIMRGYEPEEVLKQAPLDALAPSSLDLAMKIFSAYVELDKLGHKVPDSRTLLLEVRRKDGTTVWTETNVSFMRDKNQRRVRILGVMRDITERKQAEKMIRQGEERYRNILETIQESYFEVDLAGNFTFFNDSLCQLTGCSKEELMGMSHQKFTDKETSKEVFKAFNKVYSTGEPSKGFDWQIIRKDGAKRYIEASISLQKDSSGKTKGFRGIIHDITERKKSEEQYRLLADNITEHVWLRDISSLKIIYISSSVEKMYGYTLDEIKNLPLKKLFTEESFKKMVDTFINEMPKAMATLPPSIHKYSFEAQAYHKDGHLLWMDNTISFLRDENGNLTLLLGETRDITERKQAEESLRHSEEKYRTIIENIQDGYFEADLAGNLTFFNNAMCVLYAYPEEELMSMNYRQYTDRETAKKLFQVFNKVYTTGMGAAIFEYEGIRKDGTRRQVEAFASLMKDSSDKITGFRGIIRDITERRKAEESLRHSEEKYRTILQSIEEGYYEVDLAGKFTFFNDSMCQIFGYSKDELMSMSYRKYSDEENSKKIFQAFNEIYNTGESIEGLYWQMIRKDGTKRYIEASASLQKDSSGKPIGFRGIVRDITERKQAEEKLQQTLENLRKSVGTTIQVLVTALETRDPYTSGHQSRSADLAKAIAEEMALPDDIIEGIRMAGIIHDIGKLAIPAEILTKPTKLTNLEFSLIMEHAQKGYEMLKDVESPWPLAQIVHQHHERMNGTGYPRNLKGDDILLEARILAVADVVEAMASHRPYRASLGINAALEEIEKNKGILYDKAVANACMRLFQEKGYQLIA
jgi:PAS domain S-box-containing protein